MGSIESLSLNVFALGCFRTDQSVHAMLPSRPRTNKNLHHSRSIIMSAKSIIAQYCVNHIQIHAHITEH